MDRMRFLATMTAFAESSALGRYVARHGHFQDWRPGGRPGGRPREASRVCGFERSFHRAMDSIDLVYCEGLAYLDGANGHGALVHHAWCLSPEDRVVDPLWDGAASESGRHYYGVPVPRALAERLGRRLGRGETILGRLALTETYRHSPLRATPFRQPPVAPRPRAAA